jgi:heme-binding NEAT domain protein
LLMSAGREASKNEIEFRDYRKFGTDSVITYDMDHISSNAAPPPPMDSSKTEEQPATSAPAQPAKPAVQKAKSADSNPWALPSAPPPPPPQ